MRFGFIEDMCRETVVRPHESREHRRSMKIDRLLTGKYTAIPSFLGVMAVIFLMTFNFSLWSVAVRSHGSRSRCGDGD